MNKFDYFLRDFEPAGNQESPSIPYEFKVDIPFSDDIHQPFIIYVIFVILKKYPYLGKGEKVSWVIPLKYKGILFFFSHRKYGFRIYSESNGNDFVQICIEALGCIKQSIPFAEELMQPFIRSQVILGNITIKNKFEDSSYRYNFFRKKAIYEFQKSSNIGSLSKAAKGKNSIQHWKDGNIYLTAMLDSYFCLLEHCLVLLLPFIQEIDAINIDIEKFILLNWKDKFNFCFPNNSDAKKIITRLAEIKEDLRNPLTHGYFLKGGKSFLVHMPGLSAVPFNLTSKKKLLRYNLENINNSAFKDICECFDETDRFLLHSKSTKYGMIFIKSKADIFFDKDSIKMYRDAMKTTKMFKDFTKYMLMIQDMAVDMDY